MVFDVFDADAGEADGYDGPVAEDFFVEGCDVGHFFFFETLVPGFVVGVHFFDGGVGFLLDELAVGGGEEGESHYEVSGDCVEAGGDHC